MLSYLAIVFKWQRLLIKQILWQNNKENIQQNVLLRFFSIQIQNRLDFYGFFTENLHFTLFTKLPFTLTRIERIRYDIHSISRMWTIYASTLTKVHMRLYVCIYTFKKTVQRNIMSLASKITFTLCCATSVVLVGYVHYMQEAER